MPTRKRSARGKSKRAPATASRRTPKRATKTARDPLGRLREICLALPEAHEAEAWGEPTFRVCNKLFAMHASASTHHGGGRESIWIKSDHVTQDLLVRAKPKQYFSPPYVGSSGWVGAWLDGRPNWTEIADLLREGYRGRAPKRLAARLDDD